VSKVLTAVAVVAAVFVPFIGPALAPIIGSAFASIGVGLTWGVASGIGSAIGAAGVLGLSGTGNKLARKKARGRLVDLDRMAVNTAADGPRKAVFGRTVMAADLRYVEPSPDSEQRYVDAIIHLASHRVTSIEEMRIGDRVAWTSSGGVAAEFAGFLTVSPILEGGPAAYHTVNSGSRWGAAQRLTGCASVKIRVDRQSTKRAASPFSAGIPSQMGFIGQGMAVYDPRRDSTVPGGSGPHRADNQSTWQYNDGGTVLGENPSLVALAYLLGWRINGKVSVGLGIPPSLLDMPAFAAAANVCDESVALAGGGTQPRYRISGLIPDDADESVVLEEIARSANGYFDDSRGRLGFFIAVNDLSGPLIAITEDDMKGPFFWDPFPEVEERYNVVRGTFLEPEMPANFQMISFPDVRIPSVDGIDRAMVVAYPMVTDSRRAQRLAKQALQRAQYRGRFRVRLGVRGWQLSYGQPVSVFFSPLGWVGKIFRVQTISFNPDASVEVEFIEENAAIYAWAAEEAPMPEPAVPIKYDPRNNPFLITEGPQIGVEDGATRNVFRGAWAGLPMATAFVPGDEVLDQDAIWVATTAHNKTGGNGPPTLPTTSNATWQLKLQAGAGAPGSTVVPVIIYRRSATAPSLPTGTVTVTLSTGAVSGLTGGWSLSIPAYDGTPVWSAQAAAYGLATDSEDTIAPGEWIGPRELARDGQPALSGLLTNEAHVVQTAADGSGGNYTGAGGTFIVRRGETVLTSPDVSFSIVSSSGITGLSINSATGVYSLTGMSAATGTATFRATVGSQTIDRVYSISQSRAGADGQDGQDGQDGAPGQDGQDGAPGQDGDDALTITARPSVVTLLSNSAGVINSGQLPRTVKLQVYESVFDVTASASYTVSATNLTFTDLGGGEYSITGLTAETGTLLVIVSSGGKVGTLLIVVQKVRQGSSALQAIDDTLLINSSTSYVGSAQGGPLVLAVSNGTINLSVNHSYVGDSSASRLAGKVQYRTTPGSGAWIDVASETVAAGSNGPGEPDTLSFAEGLSGPPSPENWEFRYLNRRFSGGTASNDGTGQLFAVEFA
jgi:hypothetical protein